MPERAKVCTKCGEEKPVGEFGKRNDAACGLRSHCKLCVSAFHRGYRQTAKGRAAEIRRQASPERRAARKRNARSAKAKATAKRYWCSDIGKAVKRRYYRAHREHRQSLLKRFRQTPKGRAAIARGRHRRRAVIARTECTLSAEEWRLILKAQGNRCKYCDTPFSSDVLPTRDHVIPATAGGGLTKENIVASCQRCNSKKGNRLVLVA